MTSPALSPLSYTVASDITETLSNNLGLPNNMGLSALSSYHDVTVTLQGNFKNWDTLNNCYNFPKYCTVCFYNAVIVFKRCG